MATIRQALALSDQMSPVLSRIMSAMRTTINVMEQMNVASARGLDESAFRGATREIENAERALQDALNATNQVGAAANNAHSGFSRWQAAIVTANQALEFGRTLWQGFSKFTGLMDSMTMTNARLNLVNDGLRTQEELQQAIYASAQRSHGAYEDTADTVAKLNLLAGNVFKSNDESIAFAETMQKAFTVSGADPSEQSAALRQMSQALASGALRGDEFNSIMENAPLIAKAIEDYVGVSRGELRELSSEGKITSDIIKNAVFAATDDINAKFAEMPTTFAGSMEMLKNTAMMQLQPISQMFSNMINSGNFQALVQGLSGVFGIIAAVLGGVLWLVGGIFNLFISGWPMIAPILFTVAAALAAINAPLITQAALWLWNSVLVPAYTAVLTFLQIGYGVLTGSTAAASAAQFTYNSALMACPLTWILLIIIAVIAVIYMIIAAINKLTGSTISATGVILGTLTAAVSVIWNLFLTLLNLVIQSVVIPLTTAWDTFANFFGNIFNDPIATIIRMFEGLANTVLGILKTIAQGIDAIFGSNLAGTVQGWMDGVSGKADELVNKYGNGTYEEKSNVTSQIQDMLNNAQAQFSWDTGDAYKTGYGWGESIDSKMGDMFGGMDDMTSMLGDMTGMNSETFDPSMLGGNPSGGKLDSVDEVGISDEDLKYLRDIAEVDYINQYTTMRPTVQANFGDVRETADVNQVIAVLEDAVAEAYASSLARG